MSFCIKLVLCPLQRVLSVERKTNPSNISYAKEHILIHCNYAKEFWAEVIKWLCTLNVNIHLDLKNMTVSRMLHCHIYVGVSVCVCVCVCLCSGIKLFLVLQVM